MILDLSSTVQPETTSMLSHKRAICDEASCTCALIQSHDQCFWKRKNFDLPGSSNKTLSRSGLTPSYSTDILFLLSVTQLGRHIVTDTVSPTNVARTVCSSVHCGTFAGPLCSLHDRLNPAHCRIKHHVVIWILFLFCWPSHFKKGSCKAGASLSHLSLTERKECNTGLPVF